MEKGERLEKRIKPEYSEEELGETFGDYDTVRVPVDRLCILPQVRSHVNPIQSDLTVSIRKEKLVNQIDVALLTPEQFEKHLNFVNSIWKTDAKLEDYGEPNNGLYVVVIAGHSRVASVKIIQANEGTPKSINCKIHEISSSAEILSLQMTENIHGSVNPERTAIAVVEMYYFGYKESAKPSDKDHWNSYADFVRKNPGHLSEQVLSDGMAFASLSPEVRNYVLSKELYYGAGVELGKNAQIIHDYVRFNLGESLTPETENKAFKEEQIKIIDHLINLRRDSKAGVVASVKYVKSQIKMMKKKLSIASEKPEMDEAQEMFMDFNLAPKKQGDDYLEKLDKDIQTIVSHIEKRPYNLAKNYLTLLGLVTEQDYSDKIHKLDDISKKIGKGVLESLSIFVDNK